MAGIKLGRFVIHADEHDIEVLIDRLKKVQEGKETVTFNGLTALIRLQRILTYQAFEQKRDPDSNKNWPGWSTKKGGGRDKGRKQLGEASGAMKGAALNPEVQKNRQGTNQWTATVYFPKEPVYASYFQFGTSRIAGTRPDLSKEGNSKITTVLRETVQPPRHFWAGVQSLESTNAAREQDKIIEARFKELQDLFKGRAIQKVQDEGGQGANFAVIDSGRTHSADSAGSRGFRKVKLTEAHKKELRTRVEAEKSHEDLSEGRKRSRKERETARKSTQEYITKDRAGARKRRERSYKHEVVNTMLTNLENEILKRRFQSKQEAAEFAAGNNKYGLQFAGKYNKETRILRLSDKYITEAGTPEYRHGDAAEQRHNKKAAEQYRKNVASRQAAKMEQKRIDREARAAARQKERETRQAIKNLEKDKRDAKTAAKNKVKTQHQEIQDRIDKRQSDIAASASAIKQLGIHGLEVLKERNVYGRANGREHPDYIKLNNQALKIQAQQLALKDQINQYRGEIRNLKKAQQDLRKKK